MSEQEYARYLLAIDNSKGELQPEQDIPHLINESYATIVSLQAHFDRWLAE